jgi:uncharacterized membrane protein
MKEIKKKPFILLQGRIEAFVELLKNQLTKKLFENLKIWIIIIGDYALYVATLMALLIGVIGGIRLESFNIFIYSVGFSIGFILIQYVSSKFYSVNEKLIENNTTQLTSNALTDSIGLISLVLGVLVLFMNTYLAIKIPQFSPFAKGLGFFFIFTLISLISLNPDILSIKIIKSTSAGEEAIGILGYIIKLFVKLTPVFYGIGIIISTIILFVSSFGFFGNKFKMSVAWNLTFSNMIYIAVIGLLPFFAYIAFVFYFLSIDIIKAILSVPEKLDNISK